MAVSKIITGSLIDDVVTSAKIADNVTVGGTSHLGIPSGTTAQRPASPSIGNTRFNTDTGSLEFYDGTEWVSTNLIPTISSITGTIWATASSTLTISLTNVTDFIDVKYFEGSTLLATDTNRPVTSGSATSAVPSAVYGQTAGDTITIQVLNQDGTPSTNTIDKTIATLPTAGSGTLAIDGDTRTHTITSTTSFVVASGTSLSNVQVYVIGGGGAGGTPSTLGNDAGGGGGGGGMSYKQWSTLAAGSYNATVGGGGTPSTSRPGTGGDGGQSSFHSTQYANGGSGGSGNSGVGGSGTTFSGTGGSGGTASGGDINGTGGGGSNATAYVNTSAGGNGSNGAAGGGGGAEGGSEAEDAGDGGNGSSTYYTGGGGGGANDGGGNNDSASSGGSGYFSGGNGGAQGVGHATDGGGTGGGLKGIISGTPSRPNTGGGGGSFGGGGGGGAGDNGAVTTGGYGASGAVIIKYTIS